MKVSQPLLTSYQQVSGQDLETNIFSDFNSLTNDHSCNYPDDIDDIPVFEASKHSHSSQVIVTTTSKPSPTTTSPSPTLNISQFPSSAGSLQCVSPGKPIASPYSLSSTLLPSAIKQACSDLVRSSSKYLEIGDPYLTSVAVGGHTTTFALQIKLGGFSVASALCLQIMSQIYQVCTTSGSTMGGCSFTSDHNLEACILP